MANVPPRGARRADAHGRALGRIHEAEAVLQRELALLWRIHVLSSLTVRRINADPRLRGDLSLAGWRVLLTLFHAPALSANEITALWGFEKMAVNRAVKELVARNLAAGGCDPFGGRRIPLSLTAAGRALYERCLPAADAQYRALAEILSPTEREAMDRILDKLIAAARVIT